jgi:hypothetical protein
MSGTGLLVKFKGAYEILVPSVAFILAQHFSLSVFSETQFVWIIFQRVF